MTGEGHNTSEDTAPEDDTALEDDAAEDGTPEDGTGAPKDNSAPDGTDIFLDGGDINADEFMRICAYESAGTVDGTHYTAVTCPVAGGTHRVTSTLPTGIMVYGYHNVGSYGYAGGSNLTRINPLI